MKGICIPTTIINLHIQTNLKRSWKTFKLLLKQSGYSFDARKVKDKPVFEAICACGESFKAWKTKDFPLKDVRCKCGSYFVKWEKIDKSNKKA